jgi:hypothetical protein
VGLERGPLSLVRITEELLEWKSSGSVSRKSRLTAMGIRCSHHATPPTCGGCSVGIVRLRTKTTEFSFYQRFSLEWLKALFQLQKILLTYGAEPFLRSRQFYSPSRTSSILWNPKVHYRVHKSPPLVPILSHIHPIHSIPTASAMTRPYVYLHQRLRHTKATDECRFKDCISEIYTQF